MSGDIWPDGVFVRWWREPRVAVMLGLHYVPGGHGSPVCPKRSAPWDFGNFFSVFKLC